MKINALVFGLLYLRSCLSFPTSFLTNYAFSVWHLLKLLARRASRTGRSLSERYMSLLLLVFCILFSMYQQSFLAIISVSDPMPQC